MKGFDMAETDSKSPSSSVARLHISMALVLLAIYCGMCAAVDLSARSAAVAKRLDDRDLARYRALKRPFAHTRNCGDFFETLMLDEVPRANHAAGGVYFFGSSNAVFCADFDGLPPAQVKGMHNYGFPGANPTEISQFIHYLVEHEGFLASGAAKAHVVICLTQDDMLEPPGAGGFFPPYLEESGLYHYDLQDGIAPIPMRAWVKTLKVRRSRWTSFIQRCHRSLEGVPPSPPIEPRDFAKESVRAVAMSPPGSNDRQFVVLAALFDYLKHRNANITFIMLPKGTWNAGLELDAAFVAKIPPMCRADNVRMIDVSHLLRDDEFMDPHHPNFDGAAKVRDAMIEFAMSIAQAYRQASDVGGLHAD
jgi:hypothetical protein